MSNTHESTKHNSWFLLEAEKKVCWNSVYCGLTSLLDEAISSIVPSEKKKDKIHKRKSPHSVFFLKNNLPFIFLYLDPLINHQPRQKSNFYSSVNQL